LSIVATSFSVVLILIGTTVYYYRNYAAETARPLESALNKIGAKKMCTRVDDGRGWDNEMPWYKGVFEVPGDRQTATELVRAAFEGKGYHLTDGPYPLNPEDNKFYSDKTSKQSRYGNLKEGNVEVNLTVFGSKVYAKGRQFCGVEDVSNPPTNKTTISFGLNLPAFKPEKRESPLNFLLLPLLWLRVHLS
jgi:hypothetical protein